MTTNPFGTVTLPSSSDPDAVPCPTCGLPTVENFIPGEPRIHEQVRGPLGTLLPIRCREAVR